MRLSGILSAPLSVMTVVIYVQIHANAYVTAMITAGVVFCVLVSCVQLVNIWKNLNKSYLHPRHLVKKTAQAF